MALIILSPVPEWFTALCVLCASRTVVGSSPEPPLLLVDMSAGTWIKKGSAAMLTSKRSEVNLRIK